MTVASSPGKWNIHSQMKRRDLDSSVNVNVSDKMNARFLKIDLNNFQVRFAKLVFLGVKRYTFTKF